MADNDNGRTHEPSLRELCAELDGFRELMEERNKAYLQLGAEKERSAAAILALTKEAGALAERNAEKWRDNANEWRQAMSDKDRNFVTKTALWGYLIGVAGFVIMVIEVLHKTFGQ